jgi:azurin
MCRAAFCLLLLSVQVIAQDLSLFRRENLVAWCIVPFDAKKRGPEERAAMLQRMGLRHYAYDYRAEHVPQFDAEIEAAKKHGVSVDAWWFPSQLNAEALHILQVVQKHGIHPQLWVTGGGDWPHGEAVEQRLQAEVKRLEPIAKAAAAQGLKVALYNHGGWFGEPETQIEIIHRLRAQGLSNVGMVYNLHHGHAHVHRFVQLLQKMKPHLLCLCLNGMTEKGDSKGQKIMPLAQGEWDLRLLSMIAESGYSGLVGVLNHTEEDAEARLLDNLDGLDWLVPQLHEGASVGDKPKPRTQTGMQATRSMTVKGPRGEMSRGELFGHALRGGMSVEATESLRTRPLTVECQAKLESKSGYNILVACDAKRSASHWELYTHAKTGELALYQPGRGGDFRSQKDICDGQWHHLAAVITEAEVRLYVDGVQVFQRAASAQQGTVQAGRLGLGQLAEGGLGCAGVIDNVRLRSGAQAIHAVSSEPMVKDAHTLGLWDFSSLSADSVKKAASTEPVSSFYHHAPLKPEQYPLHQERVNRYRLYDFYAQQARSFSSMKPVPALVDSFPALEGGIFGHWGWLDDVDWADTRWQQADLLPMMSGVLHAEKNPPMPKAIVVQLGRFFTSAFDPTRLFFSYSTGGAFVNVGTSRHGFMNGLHFVSKRDPVWLDNAPPAPGRGTYLGLYRFEDKVIFRYQIDGVEKLDHAWSEDSLVKRDITSTTEGHLAEMAKGGPAQWPQWFETTGTLGKEKPYAVDTLTLPQSTPWRHPWYISGIDFFSDGSAAFCTFTGDVWLLRGIDSGLQKLRYKRFASGLHQPLGLRIIGDKVHVQGRDQITRLHDLNGNDEADYYECVSNALITSSSGHDYVTGCEYDGRYFYFASGNQGVCRVQPGHPVEVLGTGMRNPNGLGLSREGEVTTSVQEGDWTPTSMIHLMQGGMHHGHGGPRAGKTTAAPLVYLPRGVDNSSGGQCWAYSQKWGPLSDHFIHFSPGTASHILVLRQTVGSVQQGAVVPLPGDFRSSVQQGRMHPLDGQLYVTGMEGWGGYAVDSGCIQRVRYTGGAAQLPIHFSVHENGVFLRFSDPVSPADATQHFAQCWNYRHSAAYGSQEYSLVHPDVPGHDVLPISSTHLLEEGRAVFFEIPLITPAHIIHLHAALAPQQWRDVYITAHALATDFTAYPGYQKLAKQYLATAAAAPSSTSSPAALPSPWEQGAVGRPLAISAALGLQFSSKELQVKAGERISLTMRNPDVVPHNWVLLAPKQLATVGKAVDLLIADPSGLSQHYVPKSPHVLAWCAMVQPQQQTTIHFTAPSQPGDYPFLCSFPGHWLAMNGVLHVQ